MARPIGIDLFAGAGGLGLGFEQAGFDIVAAADIDPIHCATHQFNFPDCAIVCKSVADVTGDELRRASGIGRRDIDVVVGGPPCQGFSMIGKRALDDSRNLLVHHFVRVVLELMPKHFVFENVKGLTLGKHRQFLQELIEAFQNGGYNIAADYKVLNAADYGVPQDRRRLILMGSRRGLALPTYPEPFGYATVGDAIGDIPDAESFPDLWKQDWTKADYGKPSPYAAYLRGIADDPNDFAYRRQFDPSLLTSSLLTHHTALSRQRFAATAPNDVESISRFKKLALDGICNTLRAGTASDRGAFTSPRPIHPVIPRVITVREAARLHSYPDWFRFHATKWHGFRQIGNSVPPLLARAVGGQIMKTLRKQPEKPPKTLALGNPRLLEISMTDAAAMFGVPNKAIARRSRQTGRSAHAFQEKHEAAA
ncbi:MAG: DNA cytosine methyltransferase [Azoarcus sp.]|jgi:DNA (cytosine-5)-methyltransferase 1|nr:DNA cytosine methyltransferase [Azoarcus sp.]